MRKRHVTSEFHLFHNQLVDCWHSVGVCPASPASPFVQPEAADTAELPIYLCLRGIICKRLIICLRVQLVLIRQWLLGDSLPLTMQPVQSPYDQNWALQLPAICDWMQKTSMQQLISPNHKQVGFQCYLTLANYLTTLLNEEIRRE